jgi:type IV secretory pathway VirB10-like protein
MSLILDALKKSEKGRHDDANSVLPLIVKPRRASGNKKKKNPLLPLTIILVALAALVLVYLMSSDSPPVPQQTITEVPEETGSPIEEDQPEVALNERSQDTATAEEAMPDDAAATGIDTATLPVEMPQAPVEQEESADLAARQQILQQTGILSTRDNTAVPPRLSKISGGLRKEVEPLRLDFHVYSSDRPRRIVFINGQEYREGMSIRNGLKLVRIVPEGAVMDWKGRQFLLTVRD